MVHFGEGDVCAEGVKAGDATDTEPVEDEADSVQPSESSNVFNDESESVPCGLAEPVVGEGDLDVRVLRDKLDAFLEEIQKVAGVAEEALDAGVLVGSLDLLSVVLEENADNLADGDETRTESNRAHVESESPVHATSNGTFTTGVGFTLEVPDACGGRNDELAHAHDECVDPEEHEDLVEGNVASLFIPLHLGKEFFAGSGRWLSDREDENGADKPDGKPNHADEVSAQRQEEDPEIVSDILSSGRVDSNTNLDGSPAAAYAAEEKTCDAPDADGSVLEPESIVTLFIVSVRFEVHVDTSTDQSKLQKDDGEVDDKGAQISDQKKVDVAEKDRSHGGDYDDLP